MKKFFLFAAAVVAAMTVNARIIKFDGIDSADKLVAVAYAEIGEYTWNKDKDNAYTYPAIDYIAHEGEMMQVQLAGEANFEIQYKNGGLQNDGSMKDGAKEGILKFAKDYLQADGKNTILVFSGMRMDDEIQLLVSAKGSTNAKFAATGADADESNPESVAKIDKVEDYVVLKFYATGSEVSIKENAGGYRIVALAINEDVKQSEEGIEELIAAPKASKVVYNGQVVIVKAGRMFNLLGAEITK